MALSGPVADARRRVVILGAGGRDFHNFNVVFREDPTADVVAFTATQIPGISGRRYPSTLAGPRYPDGIPIFDEIGLENLIRDYRIDQAVFAYSDVTHEHVMHLASRVLAAGADFLLLGPERTMLSARRPVIAISAVRTGCGKSQIARWLAHWLRGRGLRVAVLRHPMPYGDLTKQRVQRFAADTDLDVACCTNEEREEYAPHIAMGNVVFAGTDYAAVLTQAEAEADILVWDGGNNDFPFLRPALHIAVIDALRPDQITTHHPGETVVRMADIAVINKADTAPQSDVRRAAAAIAAVNPRAAIVRAASPVTIDEPLRVRGRRVMVVEDGPTLTHGGMSYGAGFAAARAAGAAEIIDPRRSAAPAMQALYGEYPHIGPVLPAVGYNPAQLKALADTINGSDAEIVVSATPLDLSTVVSIEKPLIQARYAFAEMDEPGLAARIDSFISSVPLARSTGGAHA